MYAANKTWSNVMKQLRTKGELHLEDLDIAADGRHEARLTLRYMRNEGWLCSPSIGSAVLYPGPTYKHLFDSDSTAST
jgi:hypothetical protein